MPDPRPADMVFASVTAVRTYPLTCLSADRAPAVAFSERDPAHAADVIVYFGKAGIFMSSNTA